MFVPVQQRQNIPYKEMFSVQTLSLSASSPLSTSVAVTAEANSPAVTEVMPVPAASSSTRLFLTNRRGVKLGELTNQRPVIPDQVGLGEDEVS